ncbi:MAG: NFACT family protein, partial [Treponema sp.]|nr:NFACT family protein [Treponema sp.]
LNANACRIHETFKAVPKTDKPLRFAQFLSSKIVNGWVTEINQLEDNRIVKITVKRPDETYKMYIRLWSNAANFIVTKDDGFVLDVMRRKPKRDEITGGRYLPEEKKSEQAAGERKIEKRVYEVRNLPGEGSFNKKIDEYYASQGGSLSLEVLKEQVRRTYEGSLGRINAALERLREKEVSFADSARFKNYGDLIL